MFAACGGGEAGSSAIGAAASPGQSGTLTWALADRPTTLDPLYARSSADELAARQLHEPLVEELGGPFEDARRLPGLALSVLPSADRTVWRVRLRQEVRFQDGSPFNASAVLVNVRRWLDVAAGREVLGAPLFDAPRPDLVRFILAEPDAAFDQRLASPRLGIVSPRAIEEAAGAPLDPAGFPDSGTGPFDLREHSADRLLLARNTGWWGGRHGLGPGIDQLELRAVPNAGERLAALRQGSVQVAELDRAELREAGADPLLSLIAQGGGRGLGVERSVRGIPAGVEVPSLNAVWLTGIDAG